MEMSPCPPPSAFQRGRKALAVRSCLKERHPASLELVTERSPRRQVQTMPTLWELMGTVTGQMKNNGTENERVKRQRENLAYKIKPIARPDYENTV